MLIPRVSQHLSQGISNFDIAAGTPGRPHGRVMVSAVLTPWSSSGSLRRARFLGRCPTLPMDVLEKPSHQLQWKIFLILAKREKIR